MKYLIPCLIVVCTIAYLIQKDDSIPERTVVVNPCSAYVGKVKTGEISIRLLILKHCPDQIANQDANQALQAANVAASKGLSIKDIGNFHINKEGQTSGIAVVWGEKLDDLQGLKQFVKEQSQIGAEQGDTLIVYTIGHGGGDGGLMRIGQRRGIMRVLAEVAEENEQEILWWQLSCHAAAGLPAISSLTEKQQEFFSMTASSPANELSYFATQGPQMQKLFVAMAEQHTEIDPNQDSIITAGELKAFMIKHFGQKRGQLVYARSEDEPIFGLLGGLANRIPIIDRNNPQAEYPKNYIPRPHR